MKSNRISNLAMALSLVILMVPGAIRSQTLDTSFNPGPNATVRAIAIRPTDGKIVIGGGFTSVGYNTRQRLALLSTSGSVEHFGYYGTPTFDNTVNAVVVESDGKVIVGGAFTNANGTGRKYLVRVNTDGSLDSTYPYNACPNGPVYALALQSDGKVLVAGDFSLMGSTSRNNVGRANGPQLDTTFAPTVNGPVYSIAVNSSGKVAIAGNFNYVGGVYRYYFAVLNSDGSVYGDFDPGAGASSLVYAIHINDDGVVGIGGAFSTVNYLTRERFARLSATGNADSASTGMNNYVFALVPYLGGYLVGGNFTTVVSTTREYLIRFDSTGYFHSGTDFGDFGGSDVEAIAVDAAGGIIIGGAFFSVQGVSRSCLARFEP